MYFKNFFEGADKYASEMLWFARIILLKSVFHLPFEFLCSFVFVFNFYLLLVLLMDLSLLENIDSALKGMQFSPDLFF